MLRQTRPIVVCGQSVAFSLASSQRQLPTRWGPIHPARPHETRSHSFEMSAKYSASKIKGTEHDGTHVSGRHPTDESYKSFIDKLGQLAGSSLAGNPKCISCDRLTESPGRVFLLTMDDRRQLIAKIPNPISGLAFYTTASEVATMKFLRLYTKVPVPEVFAWSPESTNELGSEYVIMEKVPGVSLAELWDGLDVIQRYNIIERVVSMEKDLASLEFPAYGALYLRSSIHNIPDLEQMHISETLDCKQLFSIARNVNAGPLGSLRDFAVSSVQREFDTVDSSDVKSQGRLEIWNEIHSTSDHRLPLQSVASIISTLSSDDRVQKVSKRVLWHPSLHLENIIVSAEDPTCILGIIGWRSSQILPIFLQARFPEFLETPSFFKFGDSLLSLAGFGELSPEEQNRALKMKDLVARSKYYEWCLVEGHKLAYESMNLEPLLAEPFRHCQSGNSVALLQCLRSVSKNWARLALRGD